MLVRLVGRVARFLKRDEGATAVQYAIVLALIIGGLIVFIRNVGNSTNNALIRDSNQLVPTSGS